MFARKRKEKSFIGNADVSLIQYLSNEERYADLINAYVFHGRRVVSGRDVKEADSRRTGRNRRSRGRKKKYRQRYRDLVRKTIFGLNCIIIAIENQNLIHYAMPIRVMDGDALEYSSQLMRVQDRHKLQKDLKNPAEFLGGFAKDDKVPGTFSLVIYYGEEPWDGALDVYDLLDLSDIPMEMRHLVNHYPIHVLDVHRFQNTEWFRTDLREVFELTQCTNDKQKMKEIVDANGERLENLADDAVDVLVSIINFDEEFFKDEKFRNKGGGVNMCKAMREWAAEERALGHIAGHAEGLEKGRAEGRAEGHTEGRQEAIIENANSLFDYGMGIEEVAAALKLKLDSVKTWYEEWKKRTVMQAAAR